MTNWKRESWTSPRREIEFEIHLGLARVLEHFFAEDCLAVEPGWDGGPVLHHLNLIEPGGDSPVRPAVDLVLATPPALVGCPDGRLERLAHAHFGHERNRGPC